MKGLGGYHLACDAGDPTAVRTLRKRKNRGDKPFAVLAGSLAAAEALARVDDAERALLTGTRKPIVLLRRRTSRRATWRTASPRQPRPRRDAAVHPCTVSSSACPVIRRDRPSSS